MYGKIMKRIRKEKGFTQKEVYSGVVSKTFYSDFEAGKYSISIEKFELLLENLGISYTEFVYYKNEENPDFSVKLNKKIDGLYNNGDFERLYALFNEHYGANTKKVRYLAAKAYLLVLITNNNFYKFSRDPFNEIICDLENQKMWTLENIRLAKLVLLSMGEKDKNSAQKWFERTVYELEKYKKFDETIYYDEIGDLYFNYSQRLLITHDIEEAVDQLHQYSQIITRSNDLHLMVQLTFIRLLNGLYSDFPTNSESFDRFIMEALKLPVSESKFYEIIGKIHREKAKNYYQRHTNKRKL